MLLLLRSFDFIFSNSRQFSDNSWATRTKFDLAPEGFWRRIRCIEHPQGIEFLESLVPHAFFSYHPILPSGAIFNRVLFEKIGPFDSRLRGIKSEDGEFVVRCLYSGRVGALREPLVGMRRHSGNATVDKAITGHGEARVMKFVLEHHPQATIYAEQLRREIAKRNAGAFDAAFAAGYFEIVSETWEELPQHQRTPARRIKYAVAMLPGFISGPACSALQYASQSVKAEVFRRINRAQNEAAR